MPNTNSTFVFLVFFNATAIQWKRRSLLHYSQLVQGFRLFCNLVNIMYITEMWICICSESTKKVVLQVCGLREKRKKKLASIMFYFDFVLFLFFWWCMSVYVYICLCMTMNACLYVCQRLILYIWCSLRWKSRRCPCLISFLLLLFRPCTLPVGVFRLLCQRMVCFLFCF